MTILEQILEVKKQEVEELLKQRPFKLTQAPVEKPSLFKTLYNAQHLHVISEIKRASPSKGLIEGNVNPVQQALAYERAGAAAISVLTDQQFFRGSMADLQAVSVAVGLPVLCKDFIIHHLQIEQAKRAGASIILLIVAALEQEKLHELFDYATTLDLEVLVEVHDLEELQRALSIEAKLIGVNNRNLKTFEVDLARTAEIAAHFPFHEQRVLISESGIQDAADAVTVSRVGARAVLVGETLMRSKNIGETLRSFHVKHGEV
ncbi:indole-3-glycerol phosphate synthase TrpC [Paenisporosarcina antarctica]|uniref:Indole-3-glycerol phosphate synthase n=1 Tax=Paenisporosarcina antarctica TaxID=417367 RepID=A0A4P7A1V6_9BACL|nr:indole-3-glycerol phosphate synthase TrpC [Paenisporosarcina antarctica]QBP42807.1 indole-3-glycerol phosphate synthase TrpC [Paenisporosarcina antarctica]